MSAAAVVAAANSNVGPGWQGFVLVVVLGAVLFVLFRSMNKHLRRVPKKFDDSHKS